MKNAYTQDEMLTAIQELQKVWNYENVRYNNLKESEKIEIDKTTVSYGIKLGTLRKLFEVS